MEQLEHHMGKVLAEFGFPPFAVTGLGFYVGATIFGLDGKARSVTVFGPSVRTEDDLRRILKRECRGIPGFAEHDRQLA